MLKRQLFEMTKLKFFFFFLKLLTGTNDFSNRDEDTNYDWILDETPRGKKGATTLATTALSQTALSLTLQKCEAQREQQSVSTVVYAESRLFYCYA
jgi:hypothetical protein